MPSNCYFCLMYHVFVFMVWERGRVLARLFSTPRPGDFMHGVRGRLYVHTCTYFLVSVLFSLHCWHTLKNPTSENWNYFWGFIFFFGKSLGELFEHDGRAASLGPFWPLPIWQLNILLQVFIYNLKVQSFCLFPNTISFIRALIHSMWSLGPLGSHRPIEQHSLTALTIHSTAGYLLQSHPKAPHPRPFVLHSRLF